ncbi:uncharacterized protein METZ01_LOCUS349699 [marine metagenome]|uniref:Uncharacterized protein n=1 Tax=marine metagenome TaxID=408172 RepID=A0A382RI57_9ZZZZ
METIAPLLTSKLLMAFLILVFIYNMVRRHNNKVRNRSTHARSRLKEHIRERQLSQWYEDQKEP